MQFKITGAYSFADTYDVIESGVIARAGRLVGAWRLEREDGKVGNLHIQAATAVRIVPNEAPALMGTMVLNMSEFENSAPGTDLLYLAYEATDFHLEGPSQQIITVEGRVVGGRGQYAGASGLLRVVSVNGFIDNGLAEVHLADSVANEQPPSPDTIRAAVARYFEGTRSMNAAQWAEAFAPNAIVQDPIAQPPLTTPEAILAQGETFVTAFERVGLQEKFVAVYGNEVVAYWEGEGIQTNGDVLRFEGVNQFRFNAQGKIVSLRGFWDPNQMRPAYSPSHD